MYTSGAFFTAGSNGVTDRYSYALILGLMCTLASTLLLADFWNEAEVLLDNLCVRVKLFLW